MTIDYLIKESHQTAKDKGWWDQKPERSFPEQIALMHSELSEALEDYRTHGLDREQMLYEINHHGLRVGMRCGIGPDDVVRGPGKPCGMATELADLLIRVFDTCGRYDIPLEEALRAKMAYNKTRPFRHGGKTC